MFKISVTILVIVVAVAIAYRASTDMVTLGGAAFAGGSLAVVDRCTRRNGVINGTECVQVVLFELFFAVIYSIGRYGQETGVFKRDEMTVNGDSTSL